MSPFAIGLIGFVMLVLLIFMRVPIAAAMGVIGVVGMGYLVNWGAGLNLLKTVPYATVATYGFCVVPLFILMGNFCHHTDVSKDLYEAVSAWLGQFRGGIAMATIGACAMFAAVSGSSMATAATLGTVALPEMKKLKYDPRLSTGAISAGGTLGILIPPSVVMVVYGILTEVSIGELFLAGFIPGVLQALFYIATIYIVCKRRPEMGPAGPRTTIQQKVGSLKKTWVIVALFVLVIGGIYAGIFSPSEAAGVGAFGALLISVARRRLTRKGFAISLLDTVKSSSMIFTILIGAMVFGYFLSVTRLPFELAEYVSQLEVNRYVILMGIVAVYVFLGCMMIPMAMLILTIPIVFPLITSLGFDPIWFGIITVRIFEIAQITPPVGMNVFIISGVAKDVPLGTIYQGVFPFLVADIINLTLLIMFPQISLLIPNMMR